MLMLSSVHTPQVAGPRIPDHILAVSRSSPLTHPCFSPGFPMRRPGCNSPCCIVPRDDSEDGDSPKYVRRQLEAAVAANKRPRNDVVDDDENIQVQHLALGFRPFTHNVASGITPPGCSKEGQAILRVAMRQNGVAGDTHLNPVKLF